MRPLASSIGRGLTTLFVCASSLVGAFGEHDASAAPAPAEPAVHSVPSSTYDPERGALIHGEAGGWEFSPYAMIAVRHQDETRGGSLAERGFRLQATRLMVHASQREWRTQFHYQFHSDEGRLATGNMYLQWDPSPWIGLLVGQNRVPYNREHITGYFYHQLVDRSAVNARFGLQRDLGVAVYLSTPDHRWEATVGLWNGARLAAANDDHAYLGTLRLAFNPQGPIPYQDGDLAMSKTPKVSFAIAIATSPSRTFAADVAKPDALSTWHDIHQAMLEHTLRFRGVSLSTEMHVRRVQRSDGPATDFGTLLQLGVLVVPHRLELLARVARIGGDKLRPGELVGEHAAGVSLYVNGHRLKVQADVAALPREDAPTDRRVRVQTSVIF